jgi:hypothetical protein
MNKKDAGIPWLGILLFFGTTGPQDLLTAQALLVQ